jgi:outer membrane protein assembly factor BamB
MAVLTLAAVASGATVGARRPAADAARQSAADLTGAWVGEVAHEGDSTPFGLEIEPAKEDMVAVKLTVPAIHWFNRAVGVMPIKIAGSQVSIGPFAFTFDSKAQTLSGTLPAAIAPVYKLPVTLRRTDKIVLGSRPAIAAPAVKPMWTYDAGAAFWGGTAFADDTVFVGDDAGTLHAIDATTGRPRWTLRVVSAVRTRPVIHDGRIYLHADNGRLYCIEAATGEEQWRATLEAAPIVRLPVDDPKTRFDRYGSDPLVAGDRIYVGTHDGKVIALERATGKPVWSFAAGDAVLAAPAIADGRVFFGSYDRHVYALDSKSGREIWKHDTGAPVVSTPAIDAGRVVVGSRSYDLLGLDAATGAVAWKRYIWFSWIESSPRVRDGIAYMGSSDSARVFAYGTASGERLWATDVGGWAWDQPAVTAERVIIGTVGNAKQGHQRGGIIALERATGRPVWQFPATPTDRGEYGFASSPAAEGDIVFVAGLDGRVYAFRVR